MPQRTTAPPGYLVLLLTLIFTLAVSIAEAQEKSQSTARVAYTEFPPYSFTDENGDPRGYSIDLIRHLMEPEGYQLQFRRVNNPAEMLDLLTNGEIDATSPLAITQDRQAYGNYTDPLGSFRLSLFVLSKTPVRTPDDLIGLRIGVVQGSVSANSVRKVPFAELVHFPTTDSMIVPLLTGSIDALATSTDTFHLRLRVAGVHGLVRELSPPLLESQYALVVSKNRPEMLRSLNRAIADRLSRADKDLLYERWFGHPLRLSEHPWFVHGVILVSAVLVIIGGLSVFAIRVTTREKRARREVRANQLLIDALNGIDAGIVIYDRYFHALHWNDGFAKQYPELLPLAIAGRTLGEMITTIQVQSSAGEPIAKTEARARADKVVAQLRAGKRSTRVIEMRNGRVIEATDLPIGEEFYAAVRVDITRLHRQSAEILEQREELKEANEKLQVFASVAAHDLKSPLNQQTTLLSFVAEDLAEAGLELPTDVAENLQIIGEVSERMKRLVSDLLDYSRSAGQPHDVTCIDPATRLKDVVALVNQPSGFEVLVAPNMPEVTVSATAFDTVLRNLIANAIKHHDRNEGRISVRGFRQDDDVVIEVEDDGPGIPEEYHQTIFEPFRRLSSDEAVEGSGLGLSFVHRTIESWGGRITVESAGTRGSVFRIVIPNRRVDDAAGSGSESESDGPYRLSA